MQLYHGSNIAVQEPRIIESDRKLDFGTGFYTTSSFEQADKWAKLTVKRREEGRATVTSYVFDETGISEMNVLRFDIANKEWLRFVSANRKNESWTEKYDIVIGPVADDRTMPVINLYFAGVYTEEEAIKRLIPQKLKDQYVFKSESALLFLKTNEVKIYE